jgi:hypothetical protein
MTALWYILFLGGGLILAIILLFIASYCRLVVARCLIVAGFLSVIGQCLLWLYIWAMANSCCGHGGKSTSIVPWLAVSIVVLTMVGSFGYALWKPTPGTVATPPSPENPLPPESPSV